MAFYIMIMLMYFMLKNTTNSTLYYDYYFGLSTLAEVLVYLQCYFNFMCLTVYTMLTNSVALGTTIFSNIAMFVVIYLHIRQFFVHGIICRFNLSVFGNCF